LLKQAEKEIKMVPIDPIRNANLSRVYGQRGTGKAQTGAANASKNNPYQTTGESVATDTHIDGVTISKQSNELDQIRQQVVDSPEVDSEKVARLRELISNGEYTVDSAQVAEKILATGVLPTSR
jgi:negative regulator of flagellin synthesis FlgM